MNTTYSEGEGHYVPKSYQFERDMDFLSDIEDRYDTLEFPEEANDHYIYDSMDALLDHKKDLEDMITHFLTVQRQRLEILDSYSKGSNHTILNGRRRTGEGKVDYRIAHNWGGYISNFITGYLGSIPIDIAADDSLPEEESERVNDAVREVNDYNNINNLNYELMFDASRAGRAFEIHYRKEEGGRYYDAIRVIDHQDMFVVRDKTIDRNIIGAVYLPVFNGKLEATIYTSRDVIRYQPSELAAVSLTEKERTPHPYKEVPVVEWWNNRFREGDWENEIGIIDAYDAAQSDTANYMSDLNDATLVVSGDIESSQLSPQDLFLMTKANMFLLQSGVDAQGKQTNLNADYIYKQYDVTGTEAYKSRLLDDLYKITNIPNLDDDRFNNQSGIAIQYKLIGLQQIKQTKINYYEKALKRRYQLINNIHEELDEQTFDANRLTFTFHENLPSDVWDEINKYINAGGQVSQQTLMEQSSFTNFENESSRLEKEEQERELPFLSDFERSGLDAED